MSDKASFYRGGAFVSESETAATRYSGMERRSLNRRRYTDRRGDVRFDLEGDRRKVYGRRADDQQQQFW